MSFFLEFFYYGEKKMPKLRVQFHEINDNLTLVSHAQSINSQLDIHMDLCLPSYLMPSFWFRHKLTSENVATILNNALPQDVWLLALSTGSSEPAPSCVKVGFSRMEDISVGSRASAVRKIVDHFATQFESAQHPMLELSPQYNQALVRHFLTEEHMQYVRNNLLPNFDFFNTTHIQSLFDFCGQKWISIHFDQNIILAVRASPRKDYDLSMRQGRKSVVCCEGVEYVLLEDASILFMSGFVNQQLH